MYNETLFHGANTGRCHDMLNTQEMLTSHGEQHWLGDGGYLFVEDFHAYKWIKDMFDKSHKRLPSTEAELSEYYGILEVNIRVSKDRVFDLTKTEHKILYDRVYKKLSVKRDIKGYAEGVVINYMFNELPDYKKEFDIVKAMFILNQGKYKHMRKRTRLGFMPQEQICIKNNDVVKAITKYDLSEKYEQFNILLKDYYFEDNTSNKCSYTSKRKYGYDWKRKR